MKIKIGSKEFEIQILETPEATRIGLSQTEKLPKKEGIAMRFESPAIIPITMQGMSFPIDIIFTLDGKVTKIVTASPGDQDINIGKPSDLIIEVNAGETSDIKFKDEVSFVGQKNEDGTVEMADGGIAVEGARQVLDEDGKNQMNLKGGERIFSRVATKRMFELAKNKELKKLGKYAITEIEKQDTRPEEYAKN